MPNISLATHSTQLVTHTPERCRQRLPPTALDLAGPCACMRPLAASFQTLKGRLYALYSACSVYQHWGTRGRRSATGLST